MAPNSARAFSSAQVHPPILPTLHKSRRVEKKLAVAAVAAAGIGYGITRYQQSQLEQEDARHYHSARSSEPSTNAWSNATTSATFATTETAAQRQKRKDQEEANMLNAYGDRSSLAELEAAVQAYESQRGK